MNKTDKKKILVVGGGFGGIRSALDMARSIKNAEITLVSDKHHFEYFPRLYHVVVGRTPLEVCIPLEEIFAKTSVVCVTDKIVSVDKNSKQVKGDSGSVYKYDFLILALGSETTYFGVEGLKELSFGFKSINEALKLKRHLHNLMDLHSKSSSEEMLANLHIVIVGGGSSGVELAGELAPFMKRVSKKHGVDPNLVSVDILEASPRILSQMPESVSVNVTKKLESYGVKIYTSKTVIKQDVETLFLKDGSMKSNTVIWTAGTMPNRLYKESGFNYDPRGKVLVDEYLQATGSENVFVIGDGASTPHAGLAQTAITDGAFVAHVIRSKILNKKIPKYNPSSVGYVIPIGRNFAVMVFGKFALYGIIPWIFRYMIDFHYFYSILSLRKALIALNPSSKLCVSCETCLHHEKEID